MKTAHLRCYNKYACRLKRYFHSFSPWSPINECNLAVHCKTRIFTWHNYLSINWFQGVDLGCHSHRHCDMSIYCPVHTAAAAVATPQTQEDKYTEISYNCHFFPIAFGTFSPVYQVGADFIAASSHFVEHRWFTSDSLLSVAITFNFSKFMKASGIEISEA